jgi:hypothetical protein
MAYDLHIEYANPDEEYAPESIPLEQWRSAVAATEGVRSYAGEVRIITIPGPRQSLPLKIMNLLRSWRRERGSPAADLPPTAGDRLPSVTEAQRIIRIRATEGDAEVWFPRDGQWHRVFRWWEGSAAFSARYEPGDASHPVWVAAVKLASHLGAVIRGDDGEMYDLQTGQVIGAQAEVTYSPEKGGAAPDDVAAMMQLVFAPKGRQATDVIEAMQRLFVKYGIPQHGFDLDGVASELEISERVKRRRTPTEVKGHGLPGLLRVQAAAQCFSTDQGEAGALQRKLRALLFHA